MVTTILSLVCSGFIVLVIVGSGFWTAGLTRGASAWAIRGVTVLSGLLLAWTSFSVIYAGSPAASGSLKVDGDVVELGDVGAGLLLLEAQVHDEDLKPGQSNHVDFLVVGEEGRFRKSSRFVLVEAAADFDGEEIPEEERRSISYSIPDLGSEMKVKLMGLKPAGGITLDATYRSTGVYLEWLAMVLLVLMFMGAFLEAAVPNGSARTFLTVALATATALVWNMRSGLIPDEALTGYLGALAWSFVEGAVLGSLLPGFLVRFVPQPKEEDEDNGD